VLRLTGRPVSSKTVAKKSSLQHPDILKDIGDLVVFHGITLFVGLSLPDRLVEKWNSDRKG
jgi:hypothetical protein